MSQKTLYSWKFNSKKSRGNTWYIIVISIAVWLVIWWFLTKQYWMSFIILLISGIAFYIENNTEDELRVDINDLWIKIWDSFYDYSRIDYFSFIYSWENAIFLRINLNKRWLRYIDLIIDNSHVNNIREVLVNFLEENPKSELTLMEKIINILKL